MDAEAIMRRREQVKKARRMGLTVSAIAKTLRVSKKTIENDLKAIKEAQRESVRWFDEEQSIGEYIQEYDEIIKMWWEKYYTIEPAKKGDIEEIYNVEKYKAFCIKMIMEAMEQKAKVLQQTGLWGAERKRAVGDKTFEARVLEIRKQREKIRKRGHTKSRKGEEIEGSVIREGETFLLTSGEQNRDE